MICKVHNFHVNQHRGIQIFIHLPIWNYIVHRFSKTNPIGVDGQCEIVYFRTGGIYHSTCFVTHDRRDIFGITFSKYQKYWYFKSFFLVWAEMYIDVLNPCHACPPTATVMLCFRYNTIVVINLLHLELLTNICIPLCWFIWKLYTLQIII